MAEPTFWNARVRRHGHTGWADAAIYAYDQRLRLRAVADAVAALPREHRRRALDFGCGVGDFTAQLATRFEHVVGHDIAPAALARARERVRAGNVAFAAARDAALGAGPFDLILLVTVLQHVLDDAELLALLRDLAASLTRGGSVIALETLRSGAAPANGYAVWRTAEELAGAFAAAGLVIASAQPFPHPVEAPSPGYRRYRQRPRVRVLRRLAGFGFSGAAVRLAEIAADGVAADDLLATDAASPSRLFVLRRQCDADVG